MSSILGIREALDSVGALEHTVIIGADAAKTPGLQYLAPCSGATVADFFSSEGDDVLIVYDDLTKHADAYRELALLRAAARNVRMDMSRFDALEALTRTGLDVDPATRQTVERGRIMREILRQPRFTVRTPADQVLAITALSEGWLDGPTPVQVRRTLWSTLERAAIEAPDIFEAIRRDTEPPDGWKERLRAIFEASWKAGDEARA